MLSNKEKRKAYNQEYYKSNHDKILAQKKLYASYNRSKISKKRKLYYFSHKKELSEYNRIYYLEHCNERKEYSKEYSATHLEDRNEYFKAYRKKRIKNDPSFRIANNLRARTWNALQGLNKSKSTFQLIGMNPCQLKSYIESKFTDGMTWDNIHIDHIAPCSLFDFTNGYDQLICFNYRNLRPILANDNLLKKSELTKEGMDAIDIILKELGTPPVVL